MSDAFSRFLVRYHSTGREKADGYSASYFSGMLDDEKCQAFDMLADESAVDPNSAEWLFLLDPARAEATCRQLLSNQTDFEYSAPFILWFYLWRHTKDVRYQQEMIDLYHEYGKSHKALAVEYAGRTAKTPQLANFLKSVVMLETSKMAVRNASYYLLRLHGVPGSTDAEKAKLRGYLASLKADSIEVKQKAISELERDFPI